MTAPKFTKKHREILGLTNTKKRFSKYDREILIQIAESRAKEEARIAKLREAAGREQRKIRDDVCDGLKIFIEKWNLITRENIDDEDFKPIKLDEWLESRFDIDDFFSYSDALLDLKQEYYSLKERDLREWTLKKFVECYKEFICTEFRKIVLYERQTQCKYVQEKIKVSKLGINDSPYAEENTFDNFVDIAIEEDDFYEDLPSFLDDDDTPKYLRPKCKYRKRFYRYKKFSETVSSLGEIF